MKHLLLTTIAAVVLVGCGPPPKDIWEAAKQGDVEAVKQFIAADSDVNAKDGYGVTPLSWAALKGHKEIVELLIANGADVNTNDWGGTPLHHAATKEIAELLIAKGADVNAKDEDGWTPLHRESLPAGSKETAELLIAKGADVNAIIVSGQNQGKTPLDWTILYKLTETADLLRKHGGKTGDWLNADKSIHKAASAGHIEAVKQHLVDGVDVNAKDGWGMTPLDHAIMNKQTEIADLLREHGGKSGAEFSIHVAAELGNIEAVKQHLAAGTDVSAKDEGGATPLHYTATKEVVELLIAKGADVNASDVDNETPLDWAILLNQSETVDLIRKHGGKTGEELKAEGK